MVRRRLYLFERAYIDYIARFRKFSRWLLSGCNSIWGWGWQGWAGITAFEVVTFCFIIVFIAGGLSMLYPQYILYAQRESQHGRPVSADILAAIFILLLALMVRSGWGALVRITSRVVTGVITIGLVISLALLAVSLTGSLFAVYLLILLTLTALLVVVFIPIRLAHWLWLFYRGIAYRCPYDDCGARGKLPLHLCTCGTRYPDLQPSFYGLFFHTCRHAGQNVKLPTMDLWGRNKLPRLCGGCQRPLVHSSLGELPEWPVAVVGGTNTGKTVFLLQAMRQARERLAALPGSTVRIDSEAQEDAFRQQLELLDRGQVVAKTAESIMAFGMAVRVRSKRLRCLLYLFDKPGEDFTSMEWFGRMQAMQHVRGIVLLVDPFALPTLASQARQLGTALMPSEDALQLIVANLLQNVELMGVPQRDEKFTVPLAVVLSKADAFPTRDYAFLADLCPHNGRPVDGALQARCREALEQLGEGGSIRALEQRFAQVGYFACSALGRMPGQRAAGAFHPVGVAEPLLWLLGEY